MPAITICSASHNSQPYLDLNYQLLSERFTDFEWLISQNGPPETFKSPFQVYQGPPKATELQSDAPKVYEASYQHAAALNMLLAKVKTRFALLLDPDFFIAQPLSLILKYMDTLGLYCFGAPYNPISTKHYKYFPCAFCMFLDLEKLPGYQSLDFTPGFGIHEPEDGISPDTGYKVYRQLRYMPSETVIPVCLENVTYNESRYSIKPFRSRGLFDAYSHGWEEFYFNNKPFGIHTHMKLHGKQLHWPAKKYAKYLTEQPKLISECIASLRA